MSSESKKLFQRRRGERPSRQAGHEKKRNDNETKTTKKKEGVDVDQQQRQKTTKCRELQPNGWPEGRCFCLKPKKWICESERILSSCQDS